MANIMAAVMFDFDNDTANRLFQPIRRANEGMGQSVDAVVGEYGPGIRPFVPAAHEEANEILLRRQQEAGLESTPLPPSRFATEYGWPEERVGTARLDKLEGRIGSKSVPDVSTALGEVAGKGFRKASPEIVEHASAMGSGYLLGARDTAADASYRDMFDPFAGSLRPTEIDPATGRAAIPGDFPALFEGNRAGFDHYVTQLFPGIERRPAELETIRQMAIEATYDTMVNAAGTVSANSAGATGFLKKGPEKLVKKMKSVKDPVTKKAVKGPDGKTIKKEVEVSSYEGDDFQKIGAMADPDDPAQIGNLRYRNQQLDPGKFGRPSWKEMNENEAMSLLGQDTPITHDQYRQLTGKDIRNSQDLTEVHYTEMIEALGGTPVKPNQKGGPVPNLQGLIEMFAPGRTMPVGESVAEKWYDDATKEALAIVGPGRYEDAMMLLELMAITSSGTEVTQNARLAIRAFAEWKLGSDDVIRNGLGLSQQEADALLKRGGRWEGLGDGGFRRGMASSQRGTTTEAFEEYVKRRGQAIPDTGPIQGGPKTQNYSGSFVVNLWEEAVDYALKDRNPELHRRVRSALDKAMDPFAWDRHMSRGANLATAVSPMEATQLRELGIQAARLADIRPEDFQAGLWYTLKDNQGFLRINRSDDMAAAMRRLWNEQKDPSLEGVWRQKILEQAPDASPQQIDHMLEEVMRQEASFAIIEKELANVGKTVNRELGEGSILKHLFNLGDDTLGIVNRAGKGIPPGVKPSRMTTQLVAEAEVELGRIRAGASGGQTYGWNGDSFVPESPDSGYAVALTSAGSGELSTSRRKSSARDIEQFIGKYGDLLDDPGVGDHIKFGTFPMDDTRTASFDLSVIVPDEATAIRLGQQFNQKAIYDIANQRVINTGGDGTPVITRPDDVRRVIEQTLGRKPSPRVGLAEAFSRGATIDEMDSVNITSILQRRVVTPIMERLEDYSNAYAKTQPPQGPAPDSAAGQLEVLRGLDRPDAGDPVENIISTQARTLLGQTFDNGESYRVRMERYYDQAERDIAALDAADIRYGPDATLEERLELVKGDDDLKKMLKDYDKAGVDPRYSTARELANTRIMRDIAEKEGIEFDRKGNGMWDLITAAWGEIALFSPKYHTGNLQGGWIQSAMGGHFTSFTPNEILAAYKLARGGLDEPTRKDIQSQLKSYQVFQKWGFDELPSWVNQGGVKAMTSNRTRASRSAVGELTSRVTRSERVGRTVGKPFAFNANFASGIEINIRGTLAADVVDREMTAAMAVLEDSIAEIAGRQGLEEFEFSILRNINPVPGGPSAKRLKEHLISMGFTEGNAERAARNFSEAKNIAENIAHKEVNKRQFSYERTNLDEMVSKIIPFHYWYSRALRYYGEESLRNPQLMLNYMRANRGIEQAQEDPGLDARQKGFLKLMGSPLGFTLLMNPDSLFGVVKVFGLSDSYTPEGETQVGGVISWLKARGLGLYPWIDGMINLMGVYGDTFEPDLLGIRHRSLIGASINFLRSQAGLEPGDTPYADAMGQARWNVSSFVSEFTPDWLAQPVKPKAGGSQSAATMDTIIESRVVAQNPSLTNEQLLDIMSNPESPEYVAAFEEVAAAGLLQQLLNFTLPQQYRMRDAARDVRSAQVSTIYEAAEAAGVEPWNFQPSQGDVQFAARYEALTGKEWQPGDYSEAMAEKNLTEALPEAKGFVLQEQQYNALGGPRGQKIMQRFQDLRNGVAESTATLPEDRRHALADLWAEQNGYTAIIDDIYRQRDAFELAHPEYGQYKGWQSQMFQLKNHLGGNLSEYRRQARLQNPNAKDYFDRIELYIVENYPSDQHIDELERRTTNAEAFFAINGLSRERYDQAPPAGVTGDPSQVQMTTNASSSYTPPEDWVTSLNSLNAWSPGQ
jgi:hypothetical protein